MASFAAREPGGGTLNTQMPMLALTSRLSWPMVKPTPVPTCDTKPSRARFPIPNKTPAARFAASMPTASGKLLTCADVPAHWAGTK